MTNNEHDKHMKAAIPAPRDYSNDLAMANNSPTKTSHALTASYSSASAHSQLPLQTNDSFQNTNSKLQSLYDNTDRSVEYPMPTAHPSIDKRQQDKPHQRSVAERGMVNPAMAYPRTQEQHGNSVHAPLDIDSRMREQQLEDLKRTKSDLREQEGQLNHLQFQYKTDIATKDQQIYSLQEQLTKKDQELKELTDRCRADVIQKDREADDFCQRWKQTAKELRKYQAQDKVVDQVTDPEVIQKARQIQYNVRNFAYQHFGGELNPGKGGPGGPGSWQDLQKHLQMPTDFFEACINSPVKRPMLVGAFVWDFLMEEIFERFRWGGTRGGMHTLAVILRKPHESNILADRSEAQRRYQMWKANTSAFLVDALKFDQEQGYGMSEKSREKVQDLRKQLAPLTKSKNEGVTTQIYEIVYEALDLDQLFSKQVAAIYWTVGVDEARYFNEALMELQHGEKRAVDGQKVQLVVAPGLIKRGRSTGEDYEIESILLKMTVSCGLITGDNRGEGYRPPVPPRESSKPVAKLKGWLKTDRA